MAVYFAEATGASLIKIGLVEQPRGLFVRGASLLSEGRNAFRAVADVTIRFLGCWPLANRADERALQFHFLPLRVTGEWFRDTPELRAYAEAAVPVDMALAFECDDWQAYADHFDVPPLDPSWLDEENALPIKARAPLAKWGVNPAAAAR